MSDFSLDFESSMEQILSNKLKTLSTTELQDIIAKAIGDHLGNNYRCTISSLIYSQPPQSKGAKITLEITESYKLSVDKSDS